VASVGSFASRPHAEMAASMLGAHGVDARVVGDDAGGAAPHINLGSGGGYTVAVPDADRELALVLLQGEAGAAGQGGEPVARPRAGLLTLGRVLVGLALVAFVVSVLWSSASL
jgi:hypothetical protein